MNTPTEPTIHIQQPGYVGTGSGQQPAGNSKVYVIDEQGQPYLIGTVVGNGQSGVGSLQIRLQPNVPPSLLRSVGINKGQYAGFIDIGKDDYSWGLGH